MSRVVSLNTMIAQCEALIDTKDVNEKDNEFLTNIVQRTRSGQFVSLLTEPQIDWIERIWQQHFA